MRRRAKAAGSTITTATLENGSTAATGVPVGWSPGKATRGREEEAVGSGGGIGGTGGVSSWEETGSTNPTTPIVEGRRQNAMPGRAPGGVSNSTDPSPHVLEKEHSQGQPHAQQQQEHGVDHAQQQQSQHASSIGQGAENSFRNTRGKSRRMTFSRRNSGVVLADVARRVSRSFSLLSRGARSNAEQPNGEDAKTGSKKSGGAGETQDASAARNEVAVDTKKKTRNASNQNSNTSNGPTPDEAAATHNTDGTVDADGTLAGAGAGRVSTVRACMNRLRHGALSSSFSKAGVIASAGGGVGEDHVSSGHQQGGHCGPASASGYHYEGGVSPGPNNKSQLAARHTRGQGIKSNSSSNVGASVVGPYARNETANAEMSTGGWGQHNRSRRTSSVAGGSTVAAGKTGTGGGGTANVAQDAIVSAPSRKKFHIPHPHLPSHFRQKHQQELQSGGLSSGESRTTALRQQAQHGSEGNGLAGEEGGVVTAGSGLSSTVAGGGAGRGGTAAVLPAPPHHQSHLPLLHLGNFLHHHKGTTAAAAADQHTQQSQSQTQQHHHLLPHLHLLHGGPGTVEASAAADAGEDSVELLAQLHAAHERARDIVERSRTQREQLLQRAREEVEEEAQAMRKEAALIFEAKQEKSDEQTEEACRAAAAAGDDVVRVDPTALLQASQLCVTETLRVGVHLPEDFRKRLSVIHQHPPTFFRKSCADQYPSTRGLRDPAVLKAALHHAYRHGYQGRDRQYGEVSYAVDEGPTSAYRGAGLDILGGATGASNVSDANREAYAAILGERGAWTEQDDEFRLDLREDAASAGGSDQRQNLLESILGWILSHSNCSPGDSNSSSGANTSAAPRGRKEDDRSPDRRTFAMCHCWPLISTDSSQ